jgi:hypothetical protein
MANSITPAGTSRSLFGVSTGDIVTGGSITGASFIGVGNKVTNLVANNITTGRLAVARGGTGNGSFINNAIVFNLNNKLVSDNNLLWENNVLTINNRDFLSDTSNYIQSEALKITESLTNTDSLINDRIIASANETSANVSNYIVSTSNILIEYIMTGQTNSVVSPATTSTLGGVQIGSGIYVNKEGIISLTPEIIYVTPPIIEDTTVSFVELPNTNYNVCKFTYDTSVGATFERDNDSKMILAIWCKFTDDPDNLIVENGIRKIKNSGYQGNLLTRLELYGDTNVRPPVDARNKEYTPLDTTYLEFNYVAPVVPEPDPVDPLEPLPDPLPDPVVPTEPVVPPTPSYGMFENEFDINSVFKMRSNWSLSISLWLKVRSCSGEITIMEFNNSDNINMRKLNISYGDNKLMFYMDKIKVPIITILEIYTNIWYHIVWSIEKREGDFEVMVSINGIKRESVNIINEYVFVLGFSKYIHNTLSSVYNLVDYNFCICDFKIHNYALGDDEKKELYAMNDHTKYVIDFKDTRTICDIMAYGGGGGGCGDNSNYGGGAGKLIYVNDAYISSGKKTIYVGRGGSAYYSNMNNYQFASRGKDTTFEHIVADGGGAVMNNIFDFQLASNIFFASNFTFFLPSAPKVIYNSIFTSNYTVINTFTCNMASNIIGGCGSGNNAQPTPFTITDDLRRFVGYTRNIYYFGNAGGEYGGGGIGTVGAPVNGGEGLYGLNLNNINIDTDRYFNFRSTIIFKNDFYLTDNTIGELNGGLVYIGCGGTGYNKISNISGTPRLGSRAKNSGSGGNYGENGKHGAVLIRYLAKIDRKTVPGFVEETSNYVLTSSNNLISYVNYVSSINNAIVWEKKANNSIYYNGGNVGIGMEPSNFRLEVAAAEWIAPEEETIPGDILTSNDFSSNYYSSNYDSSNYSSNYSSSNSNVVVNPNPNSNICAKFNSSIWTTGNVISSSDARIKTNIRDLQDDNALRMILNIEPKTYNYVDTRMTTNTVYGFIAQQIRDVIPDAVKLQTEFIPNIFTVASFDPIESAITFSDPIPAITVNSRLKCYDMRNNLIIAVVVGVISQGSFRIRMNPIHTFRGAKIFVYGTEVNDFHALNKEYINTLNVCAVQELHRKIVSQQDEINELKDKVNVLLNYIDMSKMTALEGEINEMKARYDFIINYIDLSK